MRPLPGRFGGPGIKKKACLARICLREAEETPSEDDETVAFDPPSSVHSPDHLPARRFDSAQYEPSRDDGAGGEQSSAAASAAQAREARPSLASASIDTSADTSLTVSPALRPSSPDCETADAALDPAQPAHGRPDRLERQPLVPLDTEGRAGNSTSANASCQLEVLSQMASFAESG